MADLRAAVIIDYQNVHLTGHGQFDSTRYGPKHEALVDPLHFANQLLQVRNSRQRSGHERADLRYVDVFRGEPSPDHEPKAHARNQAQKAQWERDKRVTVTLRPLKYRYQRDGNGRAITHPVTGVKVPAGPPQEKGVDVLCALALVQRAVARLPLCQTTAPMCASVSPAPRFLQVSDFCQRPTRQDDKPPGLR